ncbi:hypothetical protein IU514_14110 [Lysobacter niastensis]|uniref:Teneurin-like YD-shell domain-containing protein n=1 Tax=Lysobacter niastensis TaxID=380629 RepID=A0ABS0B8C7_9GAMM|nr:hypothetical protein [Lysobacter niastensis]
MAFYANDTLVGTDATAPYAITWSSVASGAYTLTARATDNNGIEASSPPVGVTVGAPTLIGKVEDLQLQSDQGYQLQGWACSTGRSASIDVQLYAGDAASIGTLIATYHADQPSDTGIASICQAQGAAYRFRIPITLAIRQAHANKKIHVLGISPSGADNRPLDGSGVLSVPPAQSLSRRYVYDQHHRLCKTIEPEVGATVVDYDAAGNTAWSASGLDLPSAASCDRSQALASGRAVWRGYDARNRLATLAFPDGNGDQGWTYTPDGQPEQIVTWDASGIAVTNSYTYNRRRLLTGESLEGPGGIAWSIGYGYDSAGHLAAQTYPSGTTVEYAPNAWGQPTRVGAYASGAAYYPNGAIRRFTYGNGLVHTMTQNARQLPTRSSDGHGLMSLVDGTSAMGSADVLDLHYAFDPNGNVASIADGVQGAIYDRTMQYDGLDRVITASSSMFGGDGVYQYSYDGLDNLRSAKLAGVKDHVYWYDARNRLINVKNGAGATVIGLDYDAQGNLARKNGQTYAFDYGNRLRDAAGIESYRYDGYGRRVQIERTDVSQVLSYYSQSGQLLVQHDSRKPGSTEHYYLAGSLVASADTGQYGEAWEARYQHTDALGSPVAVTDKAGNIIERTNYEPYGASIGKAIDGIGYTGHVMDAATGLTYMQQRYYDPQVGRFLSVDPVTAYDGGWRHFNRFAYAYNNPYAFTDPDGRCPVCVPAAVLSRAGLGAATGAAVEIGMQVVLDGKRSWSEIDRSDVAVAAAIGTVLPGMGSVALRAKSAVSVIKRSVSAAKKVSAQARNTANRAQKLAARETKHVAGAAAAAGDVAETAGAAATGVVLKRLGQDVANGDKSKQMDGVKIIEVRGAVDSARLKREDVENNGK